ncbi:MAG TPA: AIM24 family protein [Microthrixaceae bacterium]|nr:AIM24 family protein [Microthrixaceae bacterium]MCB9401265.1 AIM24 family protein [Microthrixaceae bacterium]MCO5306183.1 AIM24 family protein [Microthrixaceae bacterium]HNE38158.1 AIM24 family protein [Microthrixaceae bacterium]HPG13077.1 AIM24 family protein [Microthrixaceae bacterium]
MPIHGSLFQEYAETAGQDPFTLQNKKMLKIQMQYGPVNTKLGSMVAYQGDVRFQNTGSGGLNKMLKSKLTGEGVNMMVAEGTGELFVADLASEIQLFYLENDMVSVNGNNVLAFSSSIEWDIHRVNAGRASMMAGGMFNVSLRGTGYVAVTTKGDPVCLDVAGAPTYADAEAVVLWTSGVSMDVRVDTGGLKSMLRGGTGELIQMAFGGQGYVMIQPSESVVQGGAQQAQQQQSGAGGMLGGLLGG